MMRSTWWWLKNLRRCCGQLIGGFQNVPVLPVLPALTGFDGSRVGVPKCGAFV
jgi:hypothetical protein